MRNKLSFLSILLLLVLLAITPFRALIFAAVARDLYPKNHPFQFPLTNSVAFFLPKPSGGSDHKEGCDDSGAGRGDIKETHFPDCFVFEANEMALIYVRSMLPKEMREKFPAVLENLIIAWLIPSGSFDKNGFHQKINLNIFSLTKYSPKGYDKDGYNKDGFDKNGFDRYSLHKDTESTFDPMGFDIKGYNHYGIHKHSIHKPDLFDPQFTRNQNQRSNPILPWHFSPNKEGAIPPKKSRYSLWIKSALIVGVIFFMTKMVKNAHKKEKN